MGTVEIHVKWYWETLAAVASKVKTQWQGRDIEDPFHFATRPIVILVRQQICHSCRESEPSSWDLTFAADRIWKTCRRNGRTLAVLFHLQSCLPTSARPVSVLFLGHIAFFKCFPLCAKNICYLLSVYITKSSATAEMARRRSLLRLGHSRSSMLVPVDFLLVNYTNFHSISRLSRCSLLVKLSPFDTLILGNLCDKQTNGRTDKRTKRQTERPSATRSNNAHKFDTQLQLLELRYNMRVFRWKSRLGHTKHQRTEIFSYEMS